MSDLEMKNNNGWVNISDKMPEIEKYVLVNSIFCRYKHAVAFWNGSEWRCAVNGDIFMNVEFWRELPDLPKL